MGLILCPCVKAQLTAVANNQDKILKDSYHHFRRKYTEYSKIPLREKSSENVLVYMGQQGVKVDGNLRDPAIISNLKKIKDKYRSADYRVLEKYDRAIKFYSNPQKQSSASLN